MKRFSFPALIALALVYTGCATPPPVQTDQLVSVSVVNTSPVEIEEMRLVFGQELPTVLLSNLPGYEESAKDFEGIPLGKRPRLKVETVSAQGSFYRQHHVPGESARKDPRGQYNLRVHVTNGIPIRFELEPAGQMRARMLSAGRQPF